MPSFAIFTNSIVPETQLLAEVCTEMQTLFRDGQKSRIKKDQPVEVTKAYAKAGASSSKPFLRYYLFTYPQNYEIFSFWFLGFITRQTFWYWQSFPKLKILFWEQNSRLAACDGSLSRWELTDVTVQLQLYHWLLALWMSLRKKTDRCGTLQQFHFSQKVLFQVLPGPRASQNLYYMNNLKMQVLACTVQSKSKFTKWALSPLLWQHT